MVLTEVSKMVEVQAEEEALLRDGPELNGVKAIKKKNRHRNKAVAPATGLDHRFSGRQLSSQGSSDDIEVDSAISSAASEAKAPSTFPASNLMVNDQLAYGLALVMGLEATARTVSGATFSGLIHSFGPGEVVLYEVTVTAPGGEDLGNGEEESRKMQTDYVCISLNDVVDLVVESVPNDGAIDVLQAKVAPSNDKPSQKARKANLKAETKMEESLQVVPDLPSIAVVEQKQRIEETDSAERDSSDKMPKEPQLSRPQEKLVRQEPFRRPARDSFRNHREERQSNAPPSHNGRSFNGRDAPQDRPAQSQHFASTRMPFAPHNGRSQHYAPGPNYRPSRPNGNNKNGNCNQRPPNTQQRPWAHPVLPKPVEKPSQPEKSPVKPVEKDPAVVDSAKESSIVSPQKEEIAPGEEGEVRWGGPVEEKAEEPSVVANPWSSTSNVWHRRHLPSSPQASQEGSDQTKTSTYNREDSDNQRFVDSFRQAATKLNPDAVEFVPRVGSSMEERAADGMNSAPHSPNVHAAPFTPMSGPLSPPLPSGIFPFQPAPPGMFPMPGMPLSPTGGPMFPMEHFQHGPPQPHGLPPHVLPVPNMFVPLDVQPFLNGPGGFPAAPAPFFHSIAPNGEAQGIYMPILPPLESYYASLLFHQMQAQLQQQQMLQRQQSQQAPQSPPEQSFPMQPDHQQDGPANGEDVQRVPEVEQQEDEVRRPSSHSSGLTSSSSNDTLSQMTSSVSFGQLSSATSELASS